MILIALTSFLPLNDDSRKSPQSCYDTAAAWTLPHSDC
jgi:hypothetical protein